MRRFKSKKKWNNGIIYLGLFLVSMAFSIKYLYTNGLILENTLASVLINDSLGTFKNSITDVDFLFKYAFNTDLQKEEKDVPVMSEVEVAPPPDTPLKLEEPILYLYSTHQEEKYASSMLEPYNIVPNIMIASKILKEYLEDRGIKVVLEEESISDKLHSLGWKYGASYKVSRMFMESAVLNNPSLKYFVDLHRDAGTYSSTTTEIAGEKYAKMLFVIGLDYDTYEYNLDFAENLKSKLVAIDPSLCRGIMKKTGKGVNGVYNQDYSKNAILIEVGGQYNNINEVDNSLRVFADVLSAYIKEEENG